MGFFDKLFGSKKPAKPEAIAVSLAKGAVDAVATGRVEATDAIPDPVFAGEAMGKTVAIWPDEGVVYAPVAGTVSASMPHAVGIAGDDGVEVLIHIGVDTVEMNGDGFTVWCEGNTHVAAGEPLVSFDRDKVKKAGHPDIVMTIITNSDDYPALAKVAEGQVKAGDTVITTA